MRHSKPVRLETAPTGPDGSGSKQGGKSVSLFFEFTITAGRSYPAHTNAQILFTFHVSRSLQYALSFNMNHALHLEANTWNR